MTKQNQIKLIMLCLTLVLLSSIGVSYAYFTANISKENAENTVIHSGNMALTYTDGETISLNNALPGDSTTKEFSIENTGTLQTKYKVFFSELYNEFADKTDLTYTLVSNDANVSIASTQVPSLNGAITGEITIEPNETHHYVLTINFLNKNEDQNDNQGKLFTSKISIGEIKEAYEVSYFTYDPNGTILFEEDPTIRSSRNYDDYQDLISDYPNQPFIREITYNNDTLANYSIGMDYIKRMHVNSYKTQAECEASEDYQNLLQTGEYHSEYGTAQVTNISCEKELKSYDSCAYYNNELICSLDYTYESLKEKLSNCNNQDEYQNIICIIDEQKYINFTQDEAYKGIAYYDSNTSVETSCTSEMGIAYCSIID